MTNATDIIEAAHHLFTVCAWTGGAALVVMLAYAALHGWATRGRGW